MFYRFGDLIWLGVLRSGSTDGEGSAGEPQGGSEAGAADGAAGSAESSSQGSAGSAASSQGEAGGEAEGEGKKAEAAPAAKVDWRDRRIAQLTARLREAQQQAPATGAVSEAAPAPVAPAATPAAGTDAQIEARAQQIASVAEFNRQCDAAAAEGRAKFGTEVFGSRVQSLQRLVDPGDQRSLAAFNTFLSSALETGEAPRLIHELGADLDEASRILSLPPAKMAVELTKRALAKPVEEEPSGAPKPPTPIGNRGVSHDAIAPDDPDRADRLSTAEWMRRREAQEAAKYGRTAA